MNDPNYNDPNYNYTNEPDSDFDSDLDCDFEELDEHIYHDPTPFKSYDEILAARRRTKTARRGVMVGCLVVALLLIGGTVLGVFGGNFILNRAMNAMAEVVKAAEAAGIRDQVKIMIGGAPVTEAFCQQIGADAYTPDAASAADAAAAFCKA